MKPPYPRASAGEVAGRILEIAATLAVCVAIVWPLLVTAWRYWRAVFGS